MRSLHRFLQILIILHSKCHELRAVHGYLWMTNFYQTGVRLREQHNRYAALVNRHRRRHPISALLITPIAYIRNPMIAIANLQAQQQQPRQPRG